MKAIEETAMEATAMEAAAREAAAQKQQLSGTPPAAHHSVVAPPSGRELRSGRLEVPVLAKRRASAPTRLGAIVAQGAQQQSSSYG